MVWWIRERLNSFQILSLYLWFLAEEVVLQICPCVHGHIFYSLTVHDITKKADLNKTKLKILINFKFKFKHIFCYTFWLLIM